MNCSENTVKYLLFIFNLIFSLCGLGLLIVGVLLHLDIKNGTSDLVDKVSAPSIGIIVIGCIIFTIAFFGCCGAVREHHCMVITYAVLLLTILVIQVAVAILVFISLKGENYDEIKKDYKNDFDKYWVDNAKQHMIDEVQQTFSCCGVDSPDNYMHMPESKGVYPASCCENATGPNGTCKSQNVYKQGCSSKVLDWVKAKGKMLGIVVLAIAGVELVGIVFALCLANSIKNANRRAFGV